MLETSLLNYSKLVLLESNEDCLTYLNIIQNNGFENTIPLCLTQIAEQFCEDYSLKFVVPETFFSSAQLKSAKTDSELQILKIVENLNKYFQQKLVWINGFRPEIGTYNFFRLYHFFGALHYRAFILDRVLNALHPEKVYVFSKENKHSQNKRTYPVSEFSNCYYKLLENSVWKDKIELLPQGKNANRILRFKFHSFKSYFRKCCSFLLRKTPVISKIWVRWRNGMRCLPNGYFINSGSVRLLLLGNNGSWRSFFANPWIQKETEIYIPKTKVLVRPIELRNWFKDWFTYDEVYCGFNVYELGFFEMARIRNLALMMHKQHVKMIRFVSKFRAITYLVAADPWEQYILSIGKHLRKYRICLQHGEMGFYDNGLWEISSELTFVSHYLSYGVAVSEFKEKICKRIPGWEKCIAVGSPKLDEIKSVSSSKGEYILYGLSKFFDNSGGFLEKYTERDLRHNQTVVVDFLNRYALEKEGVKVVIKVNPNEFGGAFINSLSKNVVIERNTGFVDLIKNASIIILDRPSTTVIEACMTDKPIFCLLNDHKWRRHAKELLEKRVVFGSTPTEVKDAISNYLYNKNYPADCTNREFVRAYGCYRDDGKSIERAVATVESLINS